MINSDITNAIRDLKAGWKDPLQDVLLLHPSWLKPAMHHPRRKDLLIVPNALLHSTTKINIQSSASGKFNQISIFCKRTITIGKSQLWEHKRKPLRWPVSDIGICVEFSQYLDAIPFHDILHRRSIANILLFFY